MGKLKGSRGIGMDSFKGIDSKGKSAFKSVKNVAIESISKNIEYLKKETKTYKVEEMLKKDRAAPGYCIVEDGTVIGVINRSHLNLKLSGLYGYSLYSRRSITEVMQTEFLEVESIMPIDIVSKMAMERDCENLYDFITVVKNGFYHGIVTVKDLLEKTMEIEVFNAKQLNPLTGLPGNVAIELELERCIREDRDYCVLYIDIDNFKAYNDVYGFENGDKIIKILADIIRREVPKEQFSGHIGGDDFLVVTDRERAGGIGRGIIKRFDQEIRSLYNFKDLKKGFIVSKNRYGAEEIFPIMSISVAGVASTEIKDAYELGEMASSVKSRCKQHIGSVLIIDETS